jgi:hypothetical protein
MSAQEALQYGLIDEIVQPNDEKLRALGLPPPGMAPQLFGELPEGAEDYEFGKIVSAFFSPGSGIQYSVCEGLGAVVSLSSCGLVCGLV